MTSTFIFGQNVYLSGKLLVAGNRAGFCKNLTTNDLSSLNTTKQSTDVITSLSLIQKLTEHLDTGYNGLLLVFLNTKDFNLIVQMQNTTLYTAVATVPRPVMVNTSSTGIRNGLSVSRCGSGIQESTASISSRILSPHSLDGSSRAFRAEP